MIKSKEMARVDTLKAISKAYSQVHSSVVAKSVKVEERGKKLPAFIVLPLDQSATMLQKHETLDQ